MLKKIINNRQLPFWFLSISIMFALTLPTLIKDGMFMDAMLYTSVAHNLSCGIGTFWFPQFSLHNVAGLLSFHEQPPLVFGIQALFFKILGDSMYVERFYTFLTMVISAFLINKLWKSIFIKQPSYQKIGWLPILLWITIPVCFWSYSNNMHENTMGIFTLSSVFIYFRTVQTKKNELLGLILTGVFIFLATLSKGLPGFFPVFLPSLYWLSLKSVRLKKALVQTFIIILILFILYSILLSFPQSKESLSLYFFKRVLHRINDVPTVENRFYILFRLLMELLPQIIISIVVLLFVKHKKNGFETENQRKYMLFFFMIGVVSSLPLMLTLVQKGFYFIPSLPFFAIGLSILIAPRISPLIEHMEMNTKRYKFTLLTSFSLFIIVCTYSLVQKGKYSREKELLEDVYIIGKNISKKEIISIPNNLWNEWSLQCYLARYHSISLDPNSLREYYLTLKNSNKENYPLGYKKVTIDTKLYELYKKEN